MFLLMTTGTSSLVDMPIFIQVIFQVPPLVCLVPPSHAPIGSKSSPMAQVLALSMSSTLPQASLQVTTMAFCPHPCSRLTEESLFVQSRVLATVHERVLDRVRATMQLLDMVRCLRMALVMIAERQNVPKETVPKYLKLDLWRVSTDCSH